MYAMRYNSVSGEQLGKLSLEGTENSFERELLAAPWSSGQRGKEGGR